MKGCITLQGHQVDYELTYKKVKNVNIRIKPDGRVSVSAPQRVSRTQIEGILLRRSDFILKALARFASLEQPSCSSAGYFPGDTLWLLGRPYRLEVEKGPQNRVWLEGEHIRLAVKAPENDALRAKTVEAFYREQCRQITSRLVRDLQTVLRPMGVPVPEVKVRSMTSRWGSCTPSKQRVTFAVQLVEAPLTCVEYVVWHELVHFVHPNHSPAFYEVLSSCLPDWKERRELLNSRRYRQSEIGEEK